MQNDALKSSSNYHKHSKLYFVLAKDTIKVMQMHESPCSKYKIFLEIQIDLV